jgi:CRP/FNR family cyclic AMP-dependent transcriptional regulator
MTRTVDRVASPAYFDAVPEANVLHYERGETIFRQGDSCGHILYIRSGGVMITALSETGQSAVIAMLGPGDFLGEGCLAGQPARPGTAVAIRPTAVVPVERTRMAALLHGQHDLSDRFLSHVLTRNIRMQEDLIEHIFGAAETRLARALLRMAHIDDTGRPTQTLARIADAKLAELAGTTVSRVHLCLERFKRLGFIDFSAKSRLTIHSSLLSVVLGG